MEEVDKIFGFDDTYGDLAKAVKEDPMDYGVFIDCIRKMLEELPIARKDAWILEQAKMMPETMWQDFIMSLTGEKKITYMPTETEIDEFCKKVQDGKIYVEYETHYYEFDSDGRYMDDWKIWHNDPQGAFSFLDRTFRGCHDLLHLGEYRTVRRLLDKVCRLEFQVVEAADSEDLAEDPLFTIADVGKEQKLSMDIYEIGYDWLKAFLLDRDEEEDLKFAEKFLEILQSEICRKLNPSNFAWLISESLMDHLEEILEKEVINLDTSLKNFSDESQYWREKYVLEEKRARKQHLLLDIRKKCRKQEKETKKMDRVSVLRASWKQIGELLRALSYERYIDDQLEIDEIWKICQALVKRGKFEEEDWKIRKEILHEIISHDYYDCYGCYDPMKELAVKLYITDKEKLEFADLLSKNEAYAREAADLYHQYGRMDKYIQYLETHLNRTSKEYVELIRCYCDAGNNAGAREIAEQGLKQCKDDLTELFIYLMREAKACKDEEWYKKLYASAKRRKMADIVRIDEAIMS